MLSDGSLYPWRAGGNTVPVLQKPGILYLSPPSSNIDYRSKKAEAPASFFFFDCQRSKVIARVTQKSLRGFLDYFHAYLALRGCDHAKNKSGVPWIYLLLQNSLPPVAYFEVTEQPFFIAPDGCNAKKLWGKPTLHLSLVASVSTCQNTGKYPEVFHNLKRNGYGK